MKAKRIARIFITSSVELNRICILDLRIATKTRIVCHPFDLFVFGTTGKIYTLKRFLRAETVFSRSESPIIAIDSILPLNIQLRALMYLLRGNNVIKMYNLS